MPSIDDLNAKNIRPRTKVTIDIYDNSGSDLLLTITENELIKATASLRSDLSRISPTLPESEIEIDAYFETDVSDQLADAGEELKIQYSWKPDTATTVISPRVFYTDQRITWDNKILHIHAVDQVHLLDEELPPLYLGQDWYWNNSSTSTRNVVHGLSLAFQDFITGTRTANTGQIKNVTGSIFYTFDGDDGTFTSMPEGGGLNMILPRMTRREAIAKFMNLCRIDFDSDAINNHNDFWPTYVDAGKPRIRGEKPTSGFITIKREDCGDVSESKEPVFSSITATVSDVLWLGAGEWDETYDSNMQARIAKQKGITFEYSGFGDHYSVGAEDPQIPLQMYYFYVRPYGDDNNARKRPPEAIHPADDELWNQYGKWLLDENVATNEWAPDPNDYTFLDLSGAKWNQPLRPDIAPTETPASLWQYWESVEIIPEDADTTDAINSATFFISTNEKKINKARGGMGSGYVIQDEIFLMGHAIMRRRDDTGNINLLPDKGLEHILNMSNVIGSFTWKGDPRLQPRDFVNFQYADENLANEDGVILQTESGDDLIINQSKVITIENITVTHERGGTISEITYREGYC